MRRPFTNLTLDERRVIARLLQASCRHGPSSHAAPARAFRPPGPRQVQTGEGRLPPSGALGGWSGSLFSWLHSEQGDQFRHREPISVLLSASRQHSLSAFVVTPLGLFFENVDDMRRAVADLAPLLLKHARQPPSGHACNCRHPGSRRRAMAAAQPRRCQGRQAPVPFSKPRFPRAAARPRPWRSADRAQARRDRPESVPGPQPVRAIKVAAIARSGLRHRSALRPATGRASCPPPRKQCRQGAFGYCQLRHSQQNAGSGQPPASSISASIRRLMETQTKPRNSAGSANSRASASPAFAARKAPPASPPASVPVIQLDHAARPQARPPMDASRSPSGSARSQRPRPSGHSRRRAGRLARHRWGGAGQGRKGHALGSGRRRSARSAPSASPL